MAKKRYNKHWIETYLKMVIPNTEAPEKFHFWVAVATIAGVLRRCVYLPMGHFTWYPNFYIVLVAPPGVATKSTTIDIGIANLREIPDVVFGPDCTSWQEFIQSVQESRLDVDVSGNMDFQPMSAITMGISELGCFLDVRDSQMVNHLTDFWDCRDVPFVKKTKTQGDNVILNPFVNFVAGTTPKWLAMNYRDHVAGWGFSSRVIMLYAEEKSKLIPYPQEVWGPGGHKARFEEAHLVDDLRSMLDMKGGYSMSPDTKTWGKAWYEQHNARVREFNKDPFSDHWIRYFLARKQAHIHKLAMILAASQRSELVITGEDLEVATDRCNEIETEMGRIFGSAEVDRGATEANKMLNLIRELSARYNQPIKKADIYKYTVMTTERNLVDMAMEYLVKAELVRQVAVNGHVCLIPHNPEPRPIEEIDCS
jgi:hypothetical protein